MGWMGSHKPREMSMKEFFKREFPSINFLDIATVNRTEVYAAAEYPGQGIVAIVILLYWKNDYYNLMYKEMDEFTGPYAYQCPERILKLLSPTDNVNALRWREGCWKRINEIKRAPKIKIGATIKFNSVIRFTNGVEFDTAEVVSTKPFRFIHSGHMYTLSRKVLHRVGYAIV